MSLFEQLQDLMIKYHFRPEKKLSQFFCVNEALLQFIAGRMKLTKGDVVLEIGPGTGFLTRKLVDSAKKNGAKVIAVEADIMMLELLQNEFAVELASGDLKLIQGDILEQDFNSLGINKIASLPPYHISSDLLTKIGLTKNLEKVILVLDKGFSQKLLAFEGLFEYVALTVLINLNGKVEVLENTVEQQSFFPAPNCLSTVIQIDFDIKNNSSEFHYFLKELFRHKNKDLQRALKQSFGFLGKKFNWDEKEFNRVASNLELAQKKVYLLSPQEFLEVYEELSSDLDKKTSSKKIAKKKK
jgi:16S rRNA A1518/A1519 N6-dimethyltransferase RsmA/KsgA/DIM1 with predicted DNA glycosylase/AP lyase activity